VKVLEFLATHPVFRLEEFEDYLAERGTGNKHTTHALLAYHVKRGHLLRIRRGLYATIPMGHAPDTLVIDPYLVMTRLAGDATIAYHSALQFHGNAYSLLHQHYYVTCQRLRAFSFQGETYVPVALPKAFREMSAATAGVEQQPHRGQRVRVTSLERTLVDVLADPVRGGGWEEIWRSLEGIAYVDVDSVVDHTLRLKNANVVARVGYYLAHRREEWMVAPHWLAHLAAHAPRQPRYLDDRHREAGRLLQPWNLIVPFSILERSWEEPQ